MGYLISCLIFFFTQLVFAQNSFLKVNHEVFKCGNEISYPIRFEAKNSLYKFNKLDLVPDTEPEEVIKDLSKISPSRAGVLNYLFQTSKRVSYLPGVVIQRSSPLAAILIPENCTVEVLSELSFRNNQGFVIIQKDLFAKLSPQDKILFWFNLTLDYIQTMHVLTFQDGNFELLSGKEFTACWFSSDCRPDSVSEMNKLVTDKDFRLFYFEQDHTLVPNSGDVTFYPNGLVRAFKRYYNLTVIDTELKDTFKSTVQLPGQSSDIFSQGSFSRPHNIFHEDGTIACAYTRKGTINNSKLAPLSFDVFYPDSKWIPSPLFQFNFPLCWSSEGKITQGFMIDNEEKPFLLSFNGNEIRIDTTNNYSPENVKGSAFYFYPDGSLKWMTDAAGKVSLNGKAYAIRGITSFHPNGNVLCTQFAEDVSFVGKEGKNYECHPRNNQQCGMACFDEHGVFTGPAEGIYLFTLAKDLES